MPLCELRSPVPVRFTHGRVRYGICICRFLAVIVGGCVGDFEAEEDEGGTLLQALSCCRMWEVFKVVVCDSRLFNA